MNLDELQSIQSQERQASSLQHLRPSFYQNVGEFIQELTRERDRAAERADDPFSSPEVRRLSDDIETTKSTVEAIYERRVGKVVKMASIAAAGMPTEKEGLTDEERELFTTLVTKIEQNRDHVLDGVLEGEGAGISCSRESATETEPTADSETGAEADSGTTSDPTPEPSAASELGLDPTPDTDDAPPAPPETAGEGGVNAAEMMGDGDTDAETPTPPEVVATDATPTTQTTTDSAESGETETTNAETDTSSSVERTTVRITRDVGEVFGVDERSYDLSSEDVVSLPAENVKPLLKQGAAEPLD